MNVELEVELEEVLGEGLGWLGSLDTAAVVTPAGIC